MLHWLIELMKGTIDSGGVFSPLRVFRYVEFRAILSIVCSFAIVVICGKRTIRWLLGMKIGDQPEFYNKDLNTLMKSKANTPTMGGVLIVAAIFVTTVLLGNFHSFYVTMGLVCMSGFFVIGAVDDWLKLTGAQRGPGRREGLYSWEKFVFQIGLSLLLGIFILNYGHQKYTMELPEVKLMSQSLNLPLLKSWVFDLNEGRWVPSPHLIVLPSALFVILATLTIVFFSNAVNLTDGMDGLAGGVMSIVAFALIVLTVIAGYDEGTVLAKQLLVPYIPLADEMAIIAGAMVGACLGFLWFNCSPAQVFMGDSGSLTLGGLIGYMAVVIRQEFLLLVIGGVFVAEAFSVILQVGYFKLSGGKRIFRCAPIHHHFHLLGWTEQQVVVRFWLITALLAALALATVKLR